MLKRKDEYLYLEGVFFITSTTSWTCSGLTTCEFATPERWLGSIKQNSSARIEVLIKEAVIVDCARPHFPAGY